MSVSLNGLFKDDMVLQRDREIRIFGFTTLVERNKIKAVLKSGDGKKVSEGVTSDIYEDGSFVVVMPPVGKGGPFTLEVSGARERRKTVISRVYAGEVWLAGGQSNMEYPLIRSEDSKKIISDLPENNIHFYSVPSSGQYDGKLKEAENTSAWVKIDRDTCAGISAVAFYFAMKTGEIISRKEDEDVHIGIIGCYLKDTDAACWQSIRSLQKTPEGRRYLKDYQDKTEGKSDEQYEAELEEYKIDRDIYDGKAEVLLKNDPYMTYGEIESWLGSAPRPPAGKDSIRRPGALFDSTVLRVAPYNLKGVIFYQGESDAEDHCDDYSAVFTTLIEEWREVFRNEDLPFIFCQLPMYISKDRKYMGYDDLKWPKLRKEQEKVARDVPNAYMAVLADCGEFDNVHPADKKTPGERLADLALRFVYEYDDVPAISPYVVDVRRGEGVEITFGGDYNNLNLPKIFSSGDSGFEIAGSSGHYYPAEASVDYDGRTVLLKCSQVEYALKVRYAFFSYGMANLVADTGLAAAPFEVSIDSYIGEYY